MTPRQIAKAIIAFLTTLGTWGVTAAPDGYSQAEMWGLSGVVVAGLAVFAYPNKPDGEPDPRLSEQHIPGDRGHTDQLTVVAVLLLVIVVALLVF